MSKEFAFKKCFCYRSHIHCHKAVILAQRTLMDRARDQFLARSVLAEDENVGVSLCHLVDHREHFLNGSALSDDLSKWFADLFFEKLLCFLQLVDLVVTFLQAYSRGDSCDKFFILPGLEDKIGRALFERLHSHLNIAESGDEDHNRIWIPFKDLFKPKETFFPARDVFAEIHIQQNDIVRIVVQEKRDLVGILLNDHMMVLLFEEHFGGEKHIFIVINHQNFTAFLGHVFLLI